MPLKSLSVGGTTSLSVKYSAYLDAVLAVLHFCGRASPRTNDLAALAASPKYYVDLGIWDDGDLTNVNVGSKSWDIVSWRQSLQCYRRFIVGLTFLFFSLRDTHWICPRLWDGSRRRWWLFVIIVDGTLARCPSYKRSTIALWPMWTS